MPVVPHAARGLEAVEGEWVPYKLWSSDLWWCEGCGTEIIVGHAAKPIKEQYEADFEETVQLFEPLVTRVNDC